MFWHIFSHFIHFNNSFLNRYFLVKIHSKNIHRVFPNNLSKLVVEFEIFYSFQSFNRHRKQIVPFWIWLHIIIGLKLALCTVYGIFFQINIFDIINNGNCITSFCPNFLNRLSNLFMAIKQDEWILKIIIWLGHNVLFLPSQIVSDTIQ